MADRTELVKALRRCVDIIELGDQRLLASDGPAGGQPPDITLAEWRELYVKLTKALAAADLLEGEREKTFVPTKKARFCTEGGCKDSWHVGGNYGSHVCRNPNHHAALSPTDSQSTDSGGEDDG